MENVKLFKALAAYRAEASVGKTGKNPMFKSEYTTLGDVLSALQNIHTYGLTFVQRFDGKTLFTDVVHIETGETVTSSLTIEPEKNTPQSFMSCVTYLRRASLMTMFGLNADDDDGNKATFGGSATSSLSARPNAGAVSSPSAAPAPISDKSLDEALAICANVREVNAVYHRLFKAKGITPTDDQLAKFKAQKEKVKNV